MKQNSNPADSNSRWDTDKIRQVRRRLVGAVFLLLLVLLVVSMLDSEPTIENYSISLDIPADPKTSDLPMTPNEQTVQPTPPQEQVVIAESTEALAALPETSPASDSYQTEIARLEAQKQALEEQKRQLSQLEKQKEQEKEKTKEEAKKEALKRQEALKKAEEEKKKEHAKKEQETRLTQQQKESNKPANKPQEKPANSQTGKETWVRSSQVRSDKDNSTRAVDILEGRQAKPAQNNAAASDKNRYIIQIGAYRDPRMLENLKSKIKGQGLSPFTEVSVKDGVEQTRLRVGPFKDRASAEAAIKKLSAIGLGGIIVSR